MELALFLAVLGAGLAATVPPYVKLFRVLAYRHPETYERLGRPEIGNRDPRRSLAIQRFVYSRSREGDIHPEVARTAAYLRVATPLVVVSVLACAAWMISATLGALR